MTVRWGMLSTARIGRVVASAIRGSMEAEFVAVAGRDVGKAAAYAAELGVPRSFARRCARASTCCARSRSPLPLRTPRRASTPPMPPAGAASRA